MLKEQPERVIVYAAADVQGTVASHRRLADAGESVEKTLDKSLVGLNAQGGYIFRGKRSRRNGHTLPG